MPNRTFNFLRNQSIRLRRTHWEEPNLLAEEIWSFLSRVRDPTTGRVSPDAGDGIDIDPIDPFPPINIPPFDQDFPQLPQNPPATETSGPGEGGGGGGPGESLRREVTTQITYRRTVVPGVVQSGSGSSYQVELSPNGNLSSDKLSVSCRQRQIDPNATIPAGTEADVLKISKIEVKTTELVGDITGEVFSISTEYKVVGEDYSMQVPVWK